MYRSFFLLLPFLLLVSGCTREPPSLPSSQVLRGSISSGTFTAYRLWFSHLASAFDIYSDLTVKSSGEALKDLIDQKVDFATSEIPLTSQQIRTGLRPFPVTASAVAIAYNHPTCKLTLTLKQLSSIYQGLIRNFNQLGCSDQVITPVYRDGRSGTSATVSTALSATDSSWKSRNPDPMVFRPTAGISVSGGLAIRDLLMSTPGAIGYMDAAFVSSPLQSSQLAQSGTPYSPSPSSSELALSFGAR